MSTLNNKSVLLSYYIIQSQFSPPVKFCILKMYLLNFFSTVFKFTVNIKLVMIVSLVWFRRCVFEPVYRNKKYNLATWKWYMFSRDHRVWEEWSTGPKLVSRAQRSVLLCKCHCCQQFVSADRTSHKHSQSTKPQWASGCHTQALSDSRYITPLFMARFHYQTRPPLLEFPAN